MSNYIFKGVIFCILLGFGGGLYAQLESEADSVKGKVLFKEGMSGLRDSGRWEILVEKFTEGVPLLEKAGPWPTFITMCRGLNKYYSDNYDYDSVRKYSSKIYSALVNHSTAKDADYFKALYDVGALRIRQGSYNQALGIFEEVYEFYLSGDSTDEKSYASVFQSLGLCYKETGDYDEALRFYNRSIELLEKAPSAELAIKYNQKAKLFQELGKYQEARGFYQKAIPLLDLKVETQAETLVDIYISLADISDKEKRDEDVLKNVALAKKVRADLMDDEISAIEVVLSRLELRNKRFEKALESQAASEAALIKVLSGRTRHPRLVELRQLKAEIMAAKGDLIKALEICQANLSLFTENWSYASVLDNPSIDKLSQEIYAIPVLRTKGKFLRKSFEHSSKNEELLASLDSYKKCTELISSLRRNFNSRESTLLLAEISNPALEEALEVAFELYKTDPKDDYLQAALELMELNKAALLEAEMQDVLAKGGLQIPTETLEEEKNLDNQMTDLKRRLFLFGERDSLSEKEVLRVKNWKEELFNLQNEKQRLIAQLEKDFPTYYQTKYKEQAIKLEDLQKSLSRDQVYLEYFWGENHLYKLAVSTEKVFFDQRVLKPDLLTLITEFRNDLKDRDRVMERAFDVNYFTAFCNKAHQLYEDLLSKLQEQFPNKSELVLVPDGPLNYLPFEVFLESKPSLSEPEYKNLPYLFKKFSVAYAYSGNIFLRQHDKEERDFDLEVLSIAPSYGKLDEWNPELIENLRNANTRSTFAPLKYNKEEAEEIKAIWSGRTLLGEEASEENYKRLLGKVKILHFAMHAYSNDSDPMFSGLVFSNRPTENSSLEEDEILHAQEIYDMKLSADLVVLSGCHTGAGQLRQGEGVMSLARAFAYAGVPSTSMSLWQAEDETIAHIMKNFHKNLKEGMAKSAAMQKAKLDFLQSSDRTHPYFWAAFLTIGDDSPIDQNNFPLWAYFLIGLLLFSGLYLMLRRNK